MNGFVDDKLRALLRVPVSASRGGNRMDIVAWIDTAFNGGLVIPRKLIAQLGLVTESSAEATLADGQCVELETFACFFDWFGESYETHPARRYRRSPLLAAESGRRDRVAGEAPVEHALSNASFGRKRRNPKH